MPSAIDLCSVAWAGQDGYVFLSVRDPSKTKKDKGYWRDLTFKWPADRGKVVEALDRAKSSKRDVYWCPNVFSGPHRDNDAVEDINVLYADLDEVDPHNLPKHLKPTAAWQTSYGRWQALWQLDHPIDSQTQSQLNQRLTYAIGADKGGWDITQVLRTPDTKNHKYPDEPRVKLLWLNGHTLSPVELIDDLPEVEAIELDRTPIDDVPDQAAVLRKYGKKITAHAKRLIKARRAKVGTRSEVLWELECLLAEAGLKADEIIGVVRPTVWNKFADRHDEMRQLSGEARKAIEHIGSVTAKVQDNGQEPTDALEEVIDVEPLSWTSFDAEHEPVRWMVAELWGEGEVGFISGHPKSYKSWLAIDLAISVATGTRFLGSFAAHKHNVLLIQEEDPKPIMQERLAMVGASKGLIGYEANGDGTFEMWYELPDNLFIISNQGFTINEDWLDQLEVWIMKREIKLVILDPLMMMGEDVDEFKAFEVMSQILKPLKRLRARTQTAIAVVHHHTKGAGQGGAKDMYGSVALWAWEESALHLNVVGMGTVIAERFSKHALLKPVTIEVGEIKDTWKPQITRVGAANLYDALSTMDNGATVEQLVSYTNMGREAVDRQLKQLKEEGKVEQSGKRRSGQGRPSVIWRATA